MSKLKGEKKSIKMNQSGELSKNSKKQGTKEQEDLKRGGEVHKES